MSACLKQEKNGGKIDRMLAIFSTYSKIYSHPRSNY